MNNQNTTIILLIKIFYLLLFTLFNGIFFFCELIIISTAHYFKNRILYCNLIEMVGNNRYQGWETKTDTFSSTSFCIWMDKYTQKGQNFLVNTVGYDLSECKQLTKKMPVLLLKWQQP